MLAFALNLAAAIAIVTAAAVTIEHHARRRAAR